MDSERAPISGLRAPLAGMGKISPLPKKDERMTEDSLELSTKSDQIRSERSMDPRAVRSREALREGLLRLLTETSFSDITPRLIAAQAGFASATFYRHYASKDEILDEVAREEMSRLFTVTNEALMAEGPRLAMQEFFEQIDARRGIWSALLNGGAASIIRSELATLSQAMASEASPISSDLPPDLAIAYSNGATLEIISWWLAQPAGHYTAEAIARLFTELVIDPVRRAELAPAKTAADQPREDS